MTTLHERAEAVRHRLGVPALGVGRFDRDGAVEVAVTGERRRGADEPVTAEDRWHIGSCGKSMTAALYGRLVEQGRARWGSTLSDLFGDLAGIDPGWGAVTIDDLLLHQARLPANLPGRVLDAYQHDRRPPTEQRTEIAARTLATARRTRGRYRYSNLGYILAGAAIERITTQPYETALHTHLLDPLGITTAGFGAPANLWGHGGRARTASIIVGRGRPVDPANAEADNPPVMNPAGRLHLTLTDWAPFLRLFLDDPDGLLSPATVNRLLDVTPHSGQAMGWAPAHRLGPASVGQQGSNGNWAATALLDQHRTRGAIIATNDGRTRLLPQSARIAAELTT